ncbi:TolC family protein [Flavobacteriaceae bacterium F89]|uniref:TolC family protein n=1 Tax=Cerina litoralis TaxID=2874477 RepID=A0AAE3EQJ8_9FLAO|nr:TolC family protein [Cerina litoralis]MCG2459188.1 TolC family protein [Cerina litoralis]
MLHLGKAYAQGPGQTQRFTLEEAIAFAQANNYSSINAGRDMEDAQKQKWETIASGLPQINGDIGYQNQLKQQVTLLPAEIAGGEPGTYIPVTFGQSQSAVATATLRQQIFDGSYIVGVQATKTFLEYSANNKEKTDLDVRKSVVQAYGNVLLAQETVSILEKNQAALDKNLRETQIIYENGLGDEESVEQLQITLASIENQLKNAERFEDITVQTLNLVMGREIYAPIQLAEDLDQLLQANMDLGIVQEVFNLENNVDYKIATNLNEQRFLELKLAKSYNLPTLNAFVNYGASAYSNNFSFFSKDQKWYDSSILGLDLKIPLFSSLGRNATIQRAKIALDKAKTQLTETEQNIQLQLERAKSDYLFAIENYNTSKDNLGLAERIEAKNETKYFEGLATSFDLRQAQTQLYSAQQEYLQSMVKVINQKTELETILNN